MKKFRDEKGQALVEFVLVLPILLILIVGIVDLGRVLYTYSSLHFTTQETVRLAGFGYNDSEITAFAKGNFTAGDESLLNVTTTPEEGSRKAGEYVTVTLNYPVDPIVPFASKVFSGPIQLSSNSTIRIE